MQKVMTRAFADYQAQDKLLDWLGELTQDGSEQVRSSLPSRWGS